MSGMDELVAFLRERLLEERERDIAEHRERFLADVPSDMQDEAAAAHDRLLIVQQARLGTAFKILGWAVIGTVWPREAKRKAHEYAEHPDYREAWRP